MNELCDLSATKLRRLIGAKLISPVELLESCVKRIEAVNPGLNALIATCTDRARVEARAAEQAVMRGETLGTLHGLPIGIKDLNETEGLRTTWGSPLYADYVPEQDERMVAALRRAGAIVVGKTNVPEFGAGANTVNSVYGPTGNPFDPARSCGGSSGGSAVALATSMLPLCTGSDTGGSLRIPAAFCGVVGFRPSPGLVPSERRPLGWSPLTVEGPMARAVEDALLLLSAQVSDDHRDPLAGPASPAGFATISPVDLSGLRVAVSEDLGFAPIERRIRETFAERVALFRSAFKSCAPRNPDMRGATEAFAATRALEFLAAHGERYREQRDKLGANIVANVEQGLAMSATDVARGHSEQTRIYRAFQDFFEDVDLLICPTVSVPPFPLEELYVSRIDGAELETYFDWLAPTYALTLTGHPCVSIPCGLEPTGTPFALQLCGPAGADKFVLDAAHALEQVLERDPRTARPRPDLERLKG
ncbi:MAG: amidase family protein [Deinococcota bacterium]|jgi:Asp-tRNA(Asn)/Glu-tRNA(Gln) amidotransferase A subunit family amidase|nr:amidase family protein [Deinococcota bacterium]